MCAEKGQRQVCFFHLLTVNLFWREIFHLEVKVQFIKSFCALAITDFEILHFIMQLQRPLVLKCQYQNKLCIELLDVHSYSYHVFEIIADINCI